MTAPDALTTEQCTRCLLPGPHEPEECLWKLMAACDRLESENERLTAINRLRFSDEQAKEIERLRHALEVTTLRLERYERPGDKIAVRPNVPGGTSAPGPSSGGETTEVYLPCDCRTLNEMQA